MKKLLFTSILILCFGATTFAQKTNTIKVASEVNEVSLHLNNAMVTQNLDLNLVPGKNTVIIQHVSPFIDGNRLFIELSQELPIQSIKTFYEVLEDKKLLSFEDSLKIKLQQIELKKKAILNLDEERNLLLENKEVGGEDKGLDIMVLKQMADYYREHLNQIDQKKYELSLEIEKMQKEHKIISKNMNEYQKKVQATHTHIALEIIVQKSTSLKLKLSYLVNNAGWIPNYDLWVKNLNAPLNLTYKAKVYNRTGKDWNNSKLTLSTIDPLQCLQKPELNRWYVYFVYRSYPKGNSQYNEYKILEKNKDGYDDKSQAEVASMGTPVPGRSQVAVNEVGVTYAIEEPYSIPADGNNYSVNIKEETIDAEFNYFTVPSQDKEAFLVAQIDNWEQLNLSNGATNVYFDKRYVGEIYLNPRTGGDTLEISVGRDPKLLISYSKLKEFSSKKIFGGNKTEEYTYEITIKNNNQYQAKILVWDHIPVSTDKQIEVKLLENNGATYTNENGKLEWDITLNPNELKKIRFSYSVKYPKGQIINLGR